MTDERACPIHRFMALVFARYVEAFCRSKQPWFKLPPDVPTFAGDSDPAKLWPPASLARYAATKAAKAKTAKTAKPAAPRARKQV